MSILAPDAAARETIFLSDLAAHVVIQGKVNINGPVSKPYIVLDADLGRLLSRDLSYVPQVFEVDGQQATRIVDPRQARKIANEIIGQEFSANFYRE